MSDLVTLAEFEEFLGGEVVAEADLRQSLLDMTEALFERECGRTATPFTGAQSARAEVRDGTGSAAIWLDYPIGTLTAVTLGFDHTAPDETLTIADLLYAAGERRIVRQDGWFGCFGAPRYVKVTYDAAADLPEDAKLAVLTGAAALYQRRGDEGIKSETAGPYSITYRDDHLLGLSPIWQAAAANHTRLVG